MEASRPTQSLDRLAGTVLIGAMAVMLMGASIGFLAPSLREAPWTDDLQQGAAAIAGNPTAYAWANGLILAATLLTALGLVPFSLGFEGRSRPWAWTALASFALAAVFETMDRIISIQVFTWAAGEGLTVSGPVIQSLVRVQGGLSALFYILGFMALALYGIAFLQEARYGVVGWWFVGGGVLGFGFLLAGAAIPAMVFFGTGALGSVSWLPGAAPHRRNPS